MNMQRKEEMESGHVFDREADPHVESHCRPHWMQDGAITFITFRLADSIPKDVLLLWQRQRLEFLKNRNIICVDWREGFKELSEPDQRAFTKEFRRRKERELDQCHGSCVLRDPELAKIVSNALLFFDDDRYFMGDHIVMPNHVHLLAVFPDATEMRKQCYSWTHYTATQINRVLGQRGDFWQEEPFDHLVRSEKQLEYLREYIEANPTKANLPEGDYLYRRSNRNY